MSKRPFLTVGLASFLSALVCSYVSFRAATVCLVLIPLSLGVTAVVLRRRSGVGHIWLAAIGAAAVMAMFLCRTALTVWPTLTYGGETVQVTVRVLEEVISDEPCLVRTEEGDLSKGTKLFLWCDRFSGLPKAGDLVSGELLLTAAFDRRSEDGRAAKAAGVYLYAWTKQGVSLRVEDGDASLSAVERTLFGLRRYVRETVNRFLPIKEAGVSRSILIGDRTALDDRVADAFRASGVYHLLAVSGLHLSVLVGAVFSLLKAAHLRRRSRALLTMTAVVLFMALCGFTASVTRAGVMTCLCLSASLFRRQADGLNSLGLAAFVMLLVDPFCVWDLGWQLSFAAALGLLTIFPVWQKEVTARCARVKYGTKAVTWLSEAVGVSLAASVLTHPLTALCFGEVSTVFLLGNMLCVWAGSLLLVVLFAALLLCLLLPSGAGLLFAFAEYICRYLFCVTDTLAAVPFALVSTAWYEAAWMVALVFASAVAYCRKGVRAIARVTMWMLVVLLLMNAVAAFGSHGTVTVSAAEAQTPVLLIESRNERGLIVSGDRESWTQAQRLCDKRDVRCVDWLLWLPSVSNTAPEEGAFTVKVAQLFLAEAVKDPLKFPAAEDVAVLGDGGTFGGETVTVCTRQGAALLTVGEKTWLICPSDRLVAALPAQWKTPDCLMVCGDLPQDIHGITPRQTIVFGKRSAAQKAALRLPLHADVEYLFTNETWQYTAKV